MRSKAARAAQKAAFCLHPGDSVQIPNPLMFRSSRKTGNAALAAMPFARTASPFFLQLFFVKSCETENENARCGRALLRRRGVRSRAVGRAARILPQRALFRTFREHFRKPRLIFLSPHAASAPRTDRRGVLYKNAKIPLIVLMFCHDMVVRECQMGELHKNAAQKSTLATVIDALQIARRPL